MDLVLRYIANKDQAKVGNPIINSQGNGRRQETGRILKGKPRVVSS
jgi:hypothetical protein